MIAKLRPAIRHHVIITVYALLQQTAFGNVLAHLDLLVQRVTSHRACQVHVRTTASAPSVEVRLFVHVQADFRVLFVKLILAHRSPDRSWKVTDHVIMVEYVMYLETHLAAPVLLGTLEPHVISHHVPLSRAHTMACAPFLAQHFHAIVRQVTLATPVKPAFVIKSLAILYLLDLTMVLLKNVAIMEIVPLSVTQNMHVPVIKVTLVMIANLGRAML